ncbi:hypothetical protein [Leptolyngbya sp. NIES-2104]|nr:hypothetical protein [Leptolyngbya sp. NIES-2104]GAP95014.1 hypothetical protein NIES2104_15330 [Leptolyngbya sp. NIES-2104]
MRSTCLHDEVHTKVWNSGCSLVAGLLGSTIVTTNSVKPLG